MPEAPGTTEAGETAPPRSRRRGPVVVRVGLLAVSWLIVAALGLLALLRLVAWDSIQPLIVLDALTQLVYLPAWVVAAGALVARRWWLAAAAIVIVAAQVAFVVPELSAAAPVPAWARQAPVVRVFDANVDQNLRFDAGYVRAIESDRPDLITLEEFTPPALQSMTASGVLASYPYRCAAPAYGATGVDRSVRASGAGNMAIVGDFNATWGNKGFIALLHDGLTDGAAARGRATGMTWPNGALVPPFVRIDHVLTGAHLTVTEIAAKPGFGSDHRYLTARIAIRT